MDLQQLDVLSRNCYYNATGKAAFKQAAMKFLRDLAKELGGGAVSWNAGGIAVSGEAILRCPRLEVMVTLSEGLAGCPVCMYRREGGRFMGANQWLGRGDVEAVAEAVRMVGVEQ